ncbi:MAG: PLP-dependent aminotransferase family protein [Hyphomicrobiaceae bacterium]
MNKGPLTQLPLAVRNVGNATLQKQVFEQIRTMIVDGRLRAGAALPATRELSSQMGISRNTAVLAYERLIAEGYIYTRPHVGTFVAATIPEETFSTKRPTEFLDHNAGISINGVEPSLRHHAPENVHNLRSPHRHKLKYDFWVGRPDPASFPAKAWAKHIGHRLQASGAGMTEYGDPAGLHELRKAIAAHLGPARGIGADPDQVIIVGGCQDGFNLVARLLVSAKTPVVVENPCYQGAAYVMQNYGGVLHPVPVDVDGLMVADLPNAPNGIVYVTPSHQYPLGVTMSLQRRLSLLAWANRNDAYIIEDDYDSDFRFTGSPLTALKGLDLADRVIYMGTFSKCMGPGLRLGYIVVPAALSEPARRLKSLMSNGQSWLEQAALADFMLDGGYRRHLRRVRQVYLSRRDALLVALQNNFGNCHVSGEGGGMHLAWKIPDKLPRAAEIEKRALENKLGVYTLSTGAALHFGPNEIDQSHLVLGYAALTPQEIAQGISTLAETIKPKPNRAQTRSISIQPEITR